MFFGAIFKNNIAIAIKKDNAKTCLILNTFIKNSSEH